MAHNVPQPQGEEAYELVQEIGRGAQGVVWGGIVKATGDPVAVKLIRKGDACLDRRLHRELKSNHVARFRNLYATDRELAIVLDYANRGNLQEYVRSRGPLPEAEARCFFQQLMLAVDYMHRKGVRHRDIKLENALLHRPAGQQALLLKLSDLGLCRTTDSILPAGPHSIVGSPQYAAPEVLLSEDGQANDLEMVDAFSCGVFLYPFDRPGEPSEVKHNETLRRMLRCEYSIPDSPPVSEACKDLIRRLIVQEPARRATVADVLRHPFYRNGLPEGALGLNDHCLRAQDTPEAQALAEQREAWVNRIWEQARVDPLGSDQTSFDGPALGWASSREVSSVTCP